MDVYTQAVSVEKREASGRVFEMMLGPKTKGDEGQHPSAPWYSQPCTYAAINSWSFGVYGGDDGARTRDLCRDRAALNEQAAAAGKGSFEFKTVPQGAATSVWAAVVAPAEQVGGRYCENCHVSDVVTDDAPLGMLDEGVRGYALDPQNAAALWKKSEEMIGEVFA
jgi:hypothetical protein